MSEVKNNNRIVWVDIYKALAITLVVIGHATGEFNRYIYQFHLAAFFFISGYVVKLDKENLMATVVKKLYTLILPLFTMIVINAIVMGILHKNGVYNVIFGELGYIGFGEIVKHFFTEGSIYAWCLGAAWFLVVLFFTSILAKILWLISVNNIKLFIGYTVFMYCIGYWLITIGVVLPYNFNLVLIAQMFYCMGFVTNKIFLDKMNNITLFKSVTAFVIASISMYFFGKIPNVTIDYASGSFHNIWLNTCTCAVGIVWLYCLSSLMSRIRGKWVRTICVTVGQNTLGVVLLHFIMFKVVFAGLYILGVADISLISQTVPDVETSSQYWLIIVIISEVLSILTWMLLKKLPWINVLIGNHKKPLIKINEWDSKISENIPNIDSYKCASKIAIRISVVVLCILYVGGVGVWGLQKYQTYQKLDITFPNSISESIVKYDAGWHPQGTEDYRWIADAGTIEVNHSRHAQLRVVGYVPEHFTEITSVQFYVNDQMLGSVDVSGNHHFDVTYDISSIVLGDSYSITIDFDGVHKPEEGSADIRELSGLITRICVE